MQKNWLYIQYHEHMNTRSLVGGYLFIWNCDLYWACYNQTGIPGHPVTSE